MFKIQRIYRVKYGMLDCPLLDSLTNMTETKCSLGLFGHEDYVADEFIPFKSVREHLGIKHLQCTFKRRTIMLWMVSIGVYVRLAFRHRKPFTGC